MTDDNFGSDNFGGDSFLTNDGILGGESAGGRSGSDDNAVITARGTGDGLVLRLDGRIQLHALKAALLSYVETRQGFLVGQEVIFEWLGARPEEGVVAELTQILSSRFGVLVKASRMVERSHKHVERDLSGTSQQNLQSQRGAAGKVEGRKLDPSPEDNFDSYRANESYKPKLSPVDGERFDRVSRISPSGTAGSSSSGTSLFDGLPAGSIAVGSSDMRQSGTGTAAASGVISESLLWDDPDTRIIRQTLRSGQKIESEFSVVINGDVNSGAEVVAGGDVIVLGKLRGVVHAGAFEESGRGRFIFAVQMQPTQLRIGSVISRGTKEESSGEAEIARVEGTMISVEPFMKGASPSKKRW